MKHKLPNYSFPLFGGIPKGKETSTLLFILFLLPFSVFAQQSFEWGAQAGGSNSEAVNDIAISGNDIYLTGHFTGTFNSGSENIKGETTNDIYLLRLNPKGSTKWLRSLGGKGINNASCLALTEKNILMGGTLAETVNQGKQSFPGESSALFVASWSSQGKIQWLTRLPYTGHATFDVLEVMNDGTLLTGGLMQGSIDVKGEKLQHTKSRRAWWATFSTIGELLEATISSGEGHHRLVGACTDQKGNTFRLFSISGDFSTGNNTTTHLPQRAKAALVLQKTNQQGKSLWIKTINGTGYVEGTKVICTSEGQVLLCTNHNKEVWSGQTIATSSSQLATAVFCFDASGKVQWVKQIISPVKARAMDMYLNGNGDVLLAGYFRESYLFNGQEYFSGTPKDKLFLLQFNKKGECTWHDEPGHDAPHFCQSFAPDQSGNIVFAGGFRGELDLQGERLKSKGREDILVAKYYNCEQKELSISGAEPICEGKEITLLATGGFQTYIWNNTDRGDNSFTASNPGSYSVIAYDDRGCSASDTVEITTISETGLGLPKEIVLLPGEQTEMAANTGFATYRWSE